MGSDATIKNKPQTPKIEYIIQTGGSSAGDGFAMPGLLIPKTAGK